MRVRVSEMGACVIMKPYATVGTKLTAGVFAANLGAKNLRVIYGWQTRETRRHCTEAWPS